MMRDQGLLPARFLVLSAHLVLTVTLLTLMDENVKAGLPLVYKQDDYERVQARFVIGLCVTILCIIIEFIGFFGGFSTFDKVVALISIVSHACACALLSLFVWDSWHSDLYWWLFMFTLPSALIELMQMSVQDSCSPSYPAQGPGQGLSPQQHFAMSKQQAQGQGPANMNMNYQSATQRPPQPHAMRPTAMQTYNQPQPHMYGTGAQQGYMPQHSPLPPHVIGHSPTPQTMMYQQQQSPVNVNNFSAPSPVQQHSPYQQAHNMHHMPMHRAQMSPHQPPNMTGAGPLPGTHYGGMSVSGPVSVTSQQRTISLPPQQVQAAAPSVSVPVQSPAASSPVTQAQTHTSHTPDVRQAVGLGPAATAPTQPLLTVQQLDDLVRQVDPLEQLDDQVKDALLKLTDELVDELCEQSCEIAKHRGSNTLEARDVQFVLQRQYNLHIPGMSGVDEWPMSSALPVTDAHKQRMEQIKKTLKKP